MPQDLRATLQILFRIYDRLAMVKTAFEIDSPVREPITDDAL
jgi:hypothetical protein